MSRAGSQAFNVACGIGVAFFVVLALGDFKRADEHEAEAERLRQEAERLRKGGKL